MADNAEKLKAEIAYLSGLIRKHKESNEKSTNQAAATQTMQSVHLSKGSHSISATGKPNKMSVYVLDRTKPVVSNSKSTFNPSSSKIVESLRCKTRVPESNARKFVQSRTANTYNSNSNKFTYRKHNFAAATASTTGEKQKSNNIPAVDKKLLTPRHPYSTPATVTKSSLVVPASQPAREAVKMILNTVPHFKVSAGEELTRTTTSVAVSNVRPILLSNTNLPRTHSNSSIRSVSSQKVSDNRDSMKSGGKNPYVLVKGTTMRTSAKPEMTFHRVGEKNKASHSKSQFKWSKGTSLSNASCSKDGTGSLSDSELCYKASKTRKLFGLPSANSYTSLRTTPASLPVNAASSSNKFSYSWRKSPSSQQLNKSNRSKSLGKTIQKPKTLGGRKTRWSKLDKHKMSNPYQLVRGKKRSPSAAIKQNSATMLRKKSKYKLVRAGGCTQSNVQGVWRPGCLLKLDRRRVSAQTSSKYPQNLSHVCSSKTGFIHRRKKVVLRNSLSEKSADVVSRYNVVRAKRKATPIRAETSKKLIIIGGVAYKSSANKLSRASASQDKSQTTFVAAKPGKRRRHSSVKKVIIRGVTYVETSTGTLIRSQLPSSAKKNATWIIQRSVEKARLSKLKAKQKSKSQQYCMFYNRFGKCNKGDKCPYTHDPSKIAVCTKFLRGTCKNTDGSCPFSHKIDKDKMPVCQFFLKGRCSNDDCPYSHVNVSSKAAVCQDFVRGYCALGKLCKKKHVLQCEEFTVTGSCSLGRKCKLMHRKSTVSTRKRKLSSTNDEIQKEIQPEIQPEKRQRKTSQGEEFLPLPQNEDTEQTAEHLEIPNEKDLTPIIRPSFLQNKLKETNYIQRSYAVNCQSKN